MSALSSDQWWVIEHGRELLRQAVRRGDHHNERWYYLGILTGIIHSSTGAAAREAMNLRDELMQCRAMPTLLEQEAWDHEMRQV